MAVCWAPEPGPSLSLLPQGVWFLDERHVPWLSFEQLLLDPS